MNAFNDQWKEDLFSVIKKKKNQKQNGNGKLWPIPVQPGWLQDKRAHLIACRLNTMKK